MLEYKEVTMSNKKLSSVEWLIGCISEDQMVKSKSLYEWLEIFEQAIAMHKEEIIESYCQGCLDITNDDTIFPRETSEQYYNETFGGQDNE